MRVAKAIIFTTITLLTIPGFILFNGDSIAGITERVSTSSSGTAGASSSYHASVSSDGRYVAFESLANNLTSGDTNGYSDIYVKDRQTGIVQRVSIATGGLQGNNHSYSPAISSDGRYAAFESLAGNLVSGDTNGYSDVFVHDRQTGITERVSIAAGGVQGNNHSYRPAISSDGRYIAFDTMATNLVAGDTNSASDVFVYDRQTAFIERVSIGTGGVQSAYTADSLHPSLSGDGRYVAFDSEANWGLGEVNYVADVFVRDRTAGTTTRISVAPGNTLANGLSQYPSISIDGRYIAFQSIASNLISGDNNGTTDIFVYDTQTNNMERVSISTTGTEGNYQSQTPSIGRNGEYVAFWSYATNLIPAGTNGYSHTYVRDRQAGKTLRMSVSTLESEGNLGSRYPSMSSDGPLAAFESTASNLTAGDTNSASDIFVREWGADVDNDGWDSLADCNDNNPAVNPGAVEICNGVDDNCDSQIDEGVKNIYYQDSDSDTYGNILMTTLACSAPPGYVTTSSDCNDANASIHPGALEVCNYEDDNCNGQTDEGLLTTYYHDADNDTYGSASAATQACTQPASYVSDSTDCNDNAASVNPAAIEVCNAVDDNCNGQIDEQCPVSETSMTNISTRAYVGTGNDRAIGGFIIEGSTPKTVMIRGRGPSMSGAPFNITGTLSNPYLRLYSSGAGAYIAQNDNWGDQSDPLCGSSGYVCGTTVEISATGLDPCIPNPGQSSAPPGCSNESAIIITLPPGSYTAVFSGVSSGTGTGLVEVFDIDGSTTTKLINISTRAKVLTGSNRVIGGFIIDAGTGSKQVLLRARGSSMSGAPFNITGTLSNPYLMLYSSTAGAYIAQNDNWGDQSDPLCGTSGYVCGTSTDISATGLDPCIPNPGQTTAPPGCSNESAMLIALPSGSYTAVVSGVNNGTGVGLVEVFEVTP